MNSPLSVPNLPQRSERSRLHSPPLISSVNSPIFVPRDDEERGEERRGEERRGEERRGGRAAGTKHRAAMKARVGAKRQARTRGRSVRSSGTCARSGHRRCSPARIHGGSAYFAGRFPTGAARRAFLSQPRGPIGCFQFSVGAARGSPPSSLRHTGFRPVRESGLNRDGGIAEHGDEGRGGGGERDAGATERARKKEEHRSSARGGRGEPGAEAGGGGRARPTRTFVTRHQTRLPPVGDSTDRL